MKATSTPYGIDLADEFNSFHRARRRRLAARRALNVILYSAGAVFLGILIGRILATI